MRGADARMIVMVAGPEQLHRLAVEEEAALRVETDVANPEPGVELVDRNSALLDAGVESVEVAIFERPQPRRIDQHLLLNRAALARPELQGHVGQRRHPSAPIIDWRSSAETGSAPLLNTSVWTRTSAPSGRSVAADERSPLRDVNEVRRNQIDVTVDAGAFVEPAFAERRVGAHGDHVRPAVIIEEVVDLDSEGRISALVAARDIAVHEHQAVAEHTVELEPHAAPAIGRGDGDRRAVPADAVVREVAADRLVTVRRQAPPRATWAAGRTAARRPSRAAPEPRPIRNHRTSAWPRPPTPRPWRRCAGRGRSRNPCRCRRHVRGGSASAPGAFDAGGPVAVTALPAPIRARRLRPRGQARRRPRRSSRAA